MFIRKVLSLVILLLISASLIQAQSTGKKIVYIENFSHTNKIGNSYVESLRNKVIEGLVATDRITVKDVNSEASLKNEAAKQTEDASNVDESTLVVMRNLQANFLIQGHVTTLEAIKVTDNNGKISYKGSIVFTLKIIDIANGTLKGAENYTYSGSGSGLLATGTGDTPDKAIANTMSSAGTDMVKLVNEYFAIEGAILEVNAENKGKITEVYVDLGEIHGMQKKQKFDVYIERQIAGRVSMKKIGELEIDAVEGDDISLCKVKKGGEEIKIAMGEGQKIIVKTVYRTGILGF